MACVIHICGAPPIPHSSLNTSGDCLTCREELQSTPGIVSGQKKRDALICAIHDARHLIKK